MKHFHKKYLILIFSLIICTFLCILSLQIYQKNNVKTFTKTFEIFFDENQEIVIPLNTTIKLTMTNEEILDSAIEKINYSLLEWHRLSDSHKNYYAADSSLIHNIKYINDHPNEWIQVDQKLYEMLKEAVTATKISQGYFNPFIGYLNSLWEPKFTNFPTTNTDPDSNLLKEALVCQPDLDQLDETLEFDIQNQQIRLNVNEACTGKIQLNLGAMAKGYILDDLAESLKEYKIPFLFDAGSSSIIAYSPDNQPYNWKIGVRSPIDSQSIFYAFQLTNGVISTSSDDQRYFILEKDDNISVRRHHILNPFTGYSENYLRGVTLFSDKNAGILDVLSTVLYNIEDVTQREEMIHNFETSYDINIDYGFIHEINNHQGWLEVSPEMEQQLILELISDQCIKLNNEER